MRSLQERQTLKLSRYLVVVLTLTVVVNYTAPLIRFITLAIGQSLHEQGRHFLKTFRVVPPLAEIK
jgi:hypothetical protein